MADRRFTRQEKMILKVVFEHQRPMSIKEIAEESHMSWVTARKYVQKLVSKEWLLKERGRKRKRFIFNYSRFEV